MNFPKRLPYIRLSVNENAFIFENNITNSLLKCTEKWFFPNELIVGRKRAPIVCRHIFTNENPFESRWEEGSLCLSIGCEWWPTQSSSSHSRAYPSPVSQSLLLVCIQTIQYNQGLKFILGESRDAIWFSVWTEGFSIDIILIPKILQWMYFINFSCTWG